MSQAVPINSRKRKTEVGTSVTENLQVAVDRLEASSTSSRLKQLMPSIVQKIEEGVQHQAIVEALGEAGLDVKLATLRTCLYRWRKRHRLREDDSPRGVTAAPSASPILQTTPRPEGVANLAPATVTVKNRGDLAQLRQAPIDMAQLAKIGKTGSKK